MAQAVTAEQIQKQYKITEDTFKTLSLPERAMYRAVYAADVLHVVEGASYNDNTGEFVLGPPYNNVGPDVNRYLQSVGASTGEPWCAAFGSCNLLDSGAKRSDLPKLAASVHDWRDWAIETNCWQVVPERTNFGLIIESPTAGHLVQVTDVLSPTEVSVVAGNTNAGGSRDGYGVFRRIYHISAFAGFVDLNGIPDPLNGNV